MTKKFFKNTTVSLGLCSSALFSVVAHFAFPAPSAIASVAPSVDDSFRLTLPLGSPRRFATRFSKESRTLALRVSPARASEFEATRYFDTRYVRRVLVEERNGEVILSLQLRNLPVGWVVTTQESPWRIVVDVWRSGPIRKETLEERWDWQDDAASEPTRSSASAPTSSLSSASTGAARGVDVPTLVRRYLETRLASATIFAPPPQGRENP